MKRRGINIDAAPAESKSRIQMAGAACRADLAQSFNSTGKQGACVTSKGKRTVLCTHTLKETTRAKGGADGRWVIFRLGVS